MQSQKPQEAEKNIFADLEPDIFADLAEEDIFRGMEEATEIEALEATLEQIPYEELMPLLSELREEADEGRGFLGEMLGMLGATELEAEPEMPAGMRFFGGFATGGAFEQPGIFPGELPLPELAMGITPTQARNLARMEVFGAAAEELPFNALLNTTALLQESKIGKGVRYATYVPTLFLPQDRKRAGRVLAEKTIPLKWEEVKLAVRAGFEGTRYAQPTDIIRRISMTRDDLRKRREFLDRHPALKASAEVSDFVFNFTISVIAEEAVEIAVLGGIPKGVGFIKNFFKGASRRTLKKGFAGAVASQMDEYDSVATALRLFDIAPGELDVPVETVSDLTRALTETSFKTIKGQWPFAPTVSEMTELVRRYGVELEISKAIDWPRVGATYTHPPPKSGVKPLIRIHPEMLKPGVELGRASLHELAHALWYNMPDILRSQWNEVFKAAKVTPDMFPTKYASTNSLDFFAETFANHNMGKFVPAATYVKFTDIMKQAGVRTVSVDDVVRVAIAKEYVAAITTAPKGTTPLVPKGALPDLIEAIGPMGAKTLDDLTPGQLEDVVQKLDTIMNAHLLPQGKDKGLRGAWRAYQRRVGKGYQTGPLSQVARHVTGPPPRIWKRLGLEVEGMDLHLAMQKARNFQIDWLMYRDEAKAGFRKAFGKRMNDDSWEAVARFTNTGPDTELPEALVKNMSPDELDYYREVARVISDDFTEVVGDIAEFELGAISADPVKIAAGIPERFQYYLHKIRDTIDSGHKERLARARANNEALDIPVNWQQAKRVKEKAPTKYNYGEYMKRVREGDEDVIFSLASIEQMLRESARLAWQQPAFDKMEAVIRNLPGQQVDKFGTIIPSQQGEAKGYFAGWVRRARGFPSPIDEAGNRIFNPVSGTVSKVTRGRWRASGKAYTNFISGLSDLTHAGLITMRSGAKNIVGQPWHTANLFGHHSAARGLEAMITKNGRRVLAHSDLRFGRGIPITGVDLTTVRGWRTFAREFIFAPISVTDDFNTAQAFLASMDYIFSHSQKHMDELVEYGINVKGLTRSQVKRAKFWDTLADALDDGKFHHLVDLSDYRGIGGSQWLYTPWNKPKHLESRTVTEAAKYTSWGTYMWGDHLPQLWEQLVTGKDIFGMKVGPVRRFAMVQAILRTGGMVLAADKMGFNISHMFFTGSLPTRFGPGVRGAVAGYKYTKAQTTRLLRAIGGLGWALNKGEEREIDKAARELQQATSSIMPKRMEAQRIWDIAEGEQPFGTLFFAPKRKEKKTGVFPIPGLRGLPAIKPVR